MSTGQVVDIRAVEEAIRATETWLADFGAFVRGHPELTTVRPSIGAGWAAAVAALAYFVGSIQTTPQDANVRRTVETIERFLQELQQPELSRARALELIRGLEFQTDNLRFYAKVYGVEVPELTIPTPSVLQRASGPTLADGVARLAVWQRAHHGTVHRSLAVAEGQEAGAMVALSAATVTVARELHHALQVVIRHALPELRRELVTLIRLERELRRETDRQIRAELRTEIRRVTERIGDVVRWLQTEALPALRDDIRAERDARRAADTEVRRRLREEVQTRESTDASLATQLAPLVAWASGFGVHTTRKVQKAEQPLDRLLNMDFSQLLLFAGFPGLVALVTKLLPAVAEATPEVLRALEGAAVRALGEVF